VNRAELPSFSSRLLDWWDVHGRKDLPWQHARMPYRVWISEIMLQQTQVATVIPYFEKWMRSFPDIGTLAETPTDNVLAHWAGLGYYARARNLHKAARICLEQHDGHLPVAAEDLCALPGIGQSTANAIISQSTDQPAAVLDGNVRRVLARHAAIAGWGGKAAVQKQLWAEAESRLPATRGADYTQAVMDLGATLCKRSSPNCGVCPVNVDCLALAQAKVSELPTPRPANKITDTTVHMLLLEDDGGRVLLEKRPPAGIWGGLWCLPSGSTVAAIEETLGMECRIKKTLPLVEHRLSHVRMFIYPSLASAMEPTQVKSTESLGWFDRAQQDELGLPKPVNDLLTKLNNGEFEI
jgi:A/G-specific adenine glycosylase